MIRRNSIKTALLLAAALVSAGACAQQSSVPSRPASWLEIPQYSKSDSLSTYTVAMEVGGRSERNYSFFWNSEHMTADWVAYPLCRGNMGEGKRSNSFGLCPFMPQSEQPVLFRGYRRGNGYWYSRGHQIPSGDRLSYKANVQTFYGVNMTPQNEELNGGVWGSLENRVRSLARRCDTLYVVTGCLYDGYEGEYVLDNDGKKVAVPTGYYKALLMRDGSSFHACAYMFENRAYENGRLDRGMMMPVAELEARTGMTFFPNLREVVGDDRYESIKNENPAGQSCWGK